MLLGEAALQVEFAGLGLLGGFHDSRRYKVESKKLLYDSGLNVFFAVKFRWEFILGKLEIYGTTVSAVWYRN